MPRPRVKPKDLSRLFRTAFHGTAPPPSATAVISSQKKLRKHSPQLNHHVSANTALPGDSTKQESHNISSILIGIKSRKSNVRVDSEVDIKDDESVDETDLPWFSNLFNNSTPLRRKSLVRHRKNKWIFKNTQKLRFDTLLGMCLDKVGSESTFQVLYKLGRGTGLKEYDAFVKGCIQTARSLKDEKAKLEHIFEAYRTLHLMKERGFPIGEDAFGPFLLYLIDMHMDEHFFILLEIVKDEDPNLHPRLGYYEMLFWIEMNNEEKVEELCQHITTSKSKTGSLLHENYLLALCEKNRKKEVLHVLEIIDITRVSSLYIAGIFQSLGRLSMEASAEKFFLILKECDHMAQSISDLIYSYVSGFKNTAVEDIILKFKEMHEKLDLAILAKSYENLIALCLDSSKVHTALDLVDEMFEAGLCLSTGALNAICHACEENCELVLVRRIYSLLRNHKLKPNGETFRSIISLNVRMKDFDGAYAVLKDLGKMNLLPSASMYNAILGGYFREKNMGGMLKVLEEMKDADVKPDSQTFGYLISTCTSEEDIIKYYEQLKDVGVHATKHIFMALINAYVASGQFSKAKEVVLDKGIPVKNINEIKSALVSSLASHGQLSDALKIFEEIKQSGYSLEPKAVISLIEHQQSSGNLNLLLQLLEELNDIHYWADGCFRVILYCIRNKELRTAISLLKKLADNFRDDKMACEVIFDEVFSQIAHEESPDLQIGLDLLLAIKEDLKLHPSRKCLDFLLSACVSKKDLHKAQFVWSEYQINGFPYNILSYLRMYQAYLASGDMEAAASFLDKVPKDDPHVRSVIHACRVTYGNPKDQEKKKKKKKKI
ncbi:unnamed protein product [Amaranthus hypochondriacus]